MSRITLAYVYPVQEKVEEQVRHFVNSYCSYPPGQPHSVMIIINGGSVTDEHRQRFSRMASHCEALEFFEHDDTGWDIGAYQALATKGNGTLHGCEILICCGGNTHFKKRGWLKRIVEEWDRFGPGLYGTLATYEIRPHINTSGFATTPGLLRQYPRAVKTKSDRYAFEHGQESFHRMVASMGLPVLLVTWDGAYPIWEWRKPENVYRRGDQSNCLTFFKHTQNFERADVFSRRRMSELADTCVDKGSFAEIVPRS